MVDTFVCGKAAVFYNTDRLPLEEIKQKTGCTRIINGYLFNNVAGSLDYFKPMGWLVIDGKVISKDAYNDWGFAVGAKGVPVMSTDRSGSFLSAVPILKNGEKLERNLTADVARPAERTAVGWLKDGRVLLWCDKEKLTRKQLQDKLLSLGCVDGLMLDGGGSTQGIFPTGSLKSTRKVPTVLLFWDEATQTKDPEEETTMFKIAMGAGHGKHTEGKRCLKAIDPNETREWVLNDRICDYVEEYLSEYEGYSLLRLDDSDDGEENPSLEARVSAANKWGADVYLSVHHNAGINGGSGGGIMAFTCPGASSASRAWRDALYDALIAHTGLKGNRSNPKAEGSYYVLQKTSMPAVLLELGFMDSTTDVPVILTQKYAQQCAQAIVEVIVARGKLTRKKQAAAKTEAELAVDWVKENGIMAGNTDGDMMLETALTRKQFAVMLYRFAKKFKIEG